ncbi:MAG: MOSC N-terminal beta barrel domain-containing protein [Bacteroidota bacterium]
MHQVGVIKSIYRYPVKSMAGEELPSAELGWHGIERDRRFAFMRTGNMSGFPWLTASKMPELIRYKAYHINGGDPSSNCPRACTGRRGHRGRA